MIIVIDKKVMIVLFVFLFVFYSRRKMNHIVNKEDREFYGKWGTMFEEFKNDKGFISTQFYLVFILRRIFFSISQVFLNSVPFVQISINITFTVILIFYIVYFRPYIEKNLMISQLIGEFSVLITMIMSILFFADLSQDSKDSLELSIMLIIFLSMIMQACVSFIDLLLKLIFKIKSKKDKKIFATMPETKSTTAQSKIIKE